VVKYFANEIGLTLGTYLESVCSRPWQRQTSNLGASRLLMAKRPPIDLSQCTTPSTLASMVEPMSQADPRRSLSPTVFCVIYKSDLTTPMPTKQLMRMLVRAKEVQYHPTHPHKTNQITRRMAARTLLFSTLYLRTRKYTTHETHALQAKGGDLRRSEVAPNKSKD
jgi:hypothetical protein